MQKLRSVHKLGKTLKWRQGLHGWTRGTSHMLNNTKTQVFLAAEALNFANSFADANRPPQLLHMTRKAGFAFGLSNTMVQRGKLELMMSYLIWANIMEKSICRCHKPNEHRWI